jgi:hypothetical protein
MMLATPKMYLVESKVSRCITQFNWGAVIIQCLLSNRIEHDWTQESEPSIANTLWTLAKQVTVKVGPQNSLHPTTPKALPLARTSRGKISAGYSQGTVSL